MTDPATVTDAEMRSTLSRIGWPLRMDAFNAITAGKPDFTAMIVRDDEPGCASILAQQLNDEMAEDFIAVVAFARHRIASTEALRSENAMLRERLAKCANDLERETAARYHGTKDYPTMARRYGREISTVTAARAVLADTQKEIK